MLSAGRGLTARGNSPLLLPGERGSRLPLRSLLLAGGVLLAAAGFLLMAYLVVEGRSLANDRQYAVTIEAIDRTAPERTREQAQETSANSGSLPQDDRQRESWQTDLGRWNNLVTADKPPSEDEASPEALPESIPESMAATNSLPAPDDSVAGQSLQAATTDTARLETATLTIDVGTADPAINQLPPIQSQPDISQSDVPQPDSSQPATSHAVQLNATLPKPAPPRPVQTEPSASMPGGLEHSGTETGAEDAVQADLALVKDGITPDIPSAKPQLPEQDEDLAGLKEEGAQAARSGAAAGGDATAELHLATAKAEEAPVEDRRAAAVHSAHVEAELAAAVLPQQNEPADGLDDARHELVEPDAVPPAPPPLRPWTGRSPRIALVIDDLGNRPAAVRRLMRLPVRPTLAFLPYPDATPALARDAATRGYEVLLHMPMEPLGDADPGPGALHVELTRDEIAARVEEAIARVPGAVGANNHMGSRFTSNLDGMRMVLNGLARHGFVFIDSRTTGGSVVAEAAVGTGVATTSRDVFLDHDPSPAAVNRQLGLVETIAAKHGSVVAIGHPNEATMAALERWIPQALARGFEFVPVRQVIALRDCNRQTDGHCNPELYIAERSRSVPER